MLACRRQPRPWPPHRRGCATPLPLWTAGRSRALGTAYANQRRRAGRRRRCRRTHSTSRPAPGRTASPPPRIHAVPRRRRGDPRRAACPFGSLMVRTMPGPVAGSVPVSTPSASALRLRGVPRCGVVTAAGVELAEFALQLLRSGLCRRDCRSLRSARIRARLVRSCPGQRVGGRDRPNLDRDGEAEGAASSTPISTLAARVGRFRGARERGFRGLSLGLDGLSGGRGGRGRLRIVEPRTWRKRGAPGFPRLWFRAHVSGSLRKRGASHAEAVSVG